MCSLSKTDHQTEYVLVATAKSFLHRQVRSIVGTIERVGSGAWTPNQIGEALRARTRSACGPVAPAHGLYLFDVRYRRDHFGDVRSSVCIEEPGAAGEI